VIENEIKKASEQGKIVIGARAVLKELRSGNLKTVVISSNCPFSRDFRKYAELSGTELVEFGGTGKQLGTVCGKPFPISTVGIKK